MPPMTERPTPDREWKECFVDFMGPIGGKNYLHTIWDNLFRWPEVEVMETTSFAKLRPSLNRSFGVLGKPDKIIHNGGLPYYGQE